VTTTIEVPAGLEGVVVAATTTGEVRGQEGTFHYRGYDATELARHASLEEVWHLQLLGHLPDGDELARFHDRILDVRDGLPAAVLDELHEEAADGDRVAALRTGWSRAASVLGCRPTGDQTADGRLRDAIALVAVGPSLVAATHRAGVAGERRTAPRGTAAAYLHLVTGDVPDPSAVAALERYLVLTIDHGLNASTFTARTVASTGADLGAVLVAGLAALSGPLHGGAPSRALEMLDAIGTPERAEPWLRAALERGDRLMGFGHRVYRTEDPRARLLRETATELGGPRTALAVHVEEVARRLLREHRPDRVLDVNVEYHAAVVLEAVGLPPTLFTPTFALARAIGWMAHALEQVAAGRIVRPTARYVGPDPRPLPPRSGARGSAVEPTRTGAWR
jgi:citrate synthase